MTTAIVFPSRIFEPRHVDDAFTDEASAVETAELAVGIVDQRALDEGSFTRASRAIAHEGLCVYRGWMLGVDHYAGLHAALAARGARLINTPEQYRACHLLPESFEVIRSRSPATVWVARDEDGVDVDEVVEAAAVFGDAPVVIKDYVKSRKHEWEEACFVPSARNEDRLRAVVSTFIERQGAALVGGIVVREYVELEPVGVHPKSGMPLTREHRVFVLDGEPLVTARYWPDAEYEDDELPLDELAGIMKAVNSRFFTMDLAKGRDGEWRIIELGDGQVAGLLDTIDPGAFYRRLRQTLDD